MYKNYSLTPITTETHDIFLSIMYATEKNFTGKQIYDRPLCLLHEEAASKLICAINTLKPLGLKIKIWDAYRPVEAQRKLYEHNPDPLYVSDPDTGVCSHCRGVAIDLTITDQRGNELAMGTEYDDLSPLAHHGNNEISQEAQRNRLLLAGVMAVAGFETFNSEWWHYQLPNLQKYPVINDSQAQTGILIH